MKNMLDLLLIAKKIKKNWDIKKLGEICIEFERTECDKYTNYTDVFNSGTEWVSIMSKVELIAIVHVKLPVCFLLKKYEKFRDLYFSYIYTVLIDDFYTQEWCISKNALNEKIPELTWLSSDKEINTSRFSIEELKFATEA